MGHRSDDVTADARTREEERRDVTERARAEERLRESEERFRAIVNQATAGICQTDLTGQFTFVNDRYCEIAGYPREELLAMRMQDITHPEDLPHNLELFARMIESGEPFVIEKRYVRRDGSRVWVNNSVSLVRDAAGQPHSVLAVTLDITKRRQAEDALRESEARFRNMADHAPVMVWVTDRDATCTYLSRSWYDFTGQTPETGLGFGWIDATHPDDQQAAHDIFVRANERREAFRLEYRLRRRDGSYAWAIDSAKPRFGEDGEFLGYVGSVIDITERKQSEERLRESEERYRTLFNSIDEGFCVIELIFDDAGRPHDYRFLEVNPTFEKQSGLENAAGKTAREMVPNLESRWFEIYGRVALTGEPIRFAEGSEAMGRWFDVYAFRVGGDASRKVAILFNDITARRKYELERERFFAVSSDIQAITGPDGYFKWVSPTWEKVLGWTAEEMTSQPWVNFAHPDDVGRSMAETDSLFSGNETIGFENRYRHKDGSYRWFIWNALPVPEEGVLYGAAIDITTRKQAEDKLRESEERLRLAIEAADMFSWEVDHTAQKLKWSENAARVIGCSDDELTDEIADGMFFVLPEDRARVNREFEQILEEGRDSFLFEFRGNESGNERKSWAAQGSIIYDTNKTPVRVVGVTQNITGRKRAEERLRESEERFRLMTENARDYAIIFLDTDARIKAWSAGAERILGWKEEEVVGQPGHIIFAPEDREHGVPENELSTAAAKGRAADERWHVRQDGSQFFGFGEMIGLFDEGGELRGFAKIFRDLTERKRMDDALRESEEKFRNLANSISQFAWMADAAGDVFWYNQRWFDYTGTTLEEMRGWDWQKVHHPEEVERVVKGFKRAIATGEPWEDTFPLRSRHGEYRWFLSRALPIRDAEGRITRWFGTNTDVEDLRRARKSAEEASRLKDEFLATVSHELRTPLTAVIGWTHILRAGQLDEAGAARALETVERNARAQNQLIEDLLDISRIITGKLRLDVRPIDPVGFIEAAIEAVQPAAEAKSVRLQKVLDTGTGAISGDADRLQQVVWNLLSNAIKFTPKGGRVQLRLERVNSHVEIIVTDTGAGIKPEFLPFVFDRFRQADGTTTRAHGGLGLGLAIVRHLVELHGGAVHADSHGEGRGATFTVKLPMIPVHQRAGEGEERVHPRARDPLPPVGSVERLDGIRLLIVDDETDTREMLRAMLAQCGADVVTARSTEEALAELRRAPFDLLISDIGMPGADGYELIGRVRSLPAGDGGRIPAVALTAYARTEDRLRALRAGYQMHVPKPVEPVEMIAVVSSLAARRGRPED